MRPRKPVAQKRCLGRGDLGILRVYLRDPLRDPTRVYVVKVLGLRLIGPSWHLGLKAYRGQVLGFRVEGTPILLSGVQSVRELWGVVLMANMQVSRSS